MAVLNSILRGQLKGRMGNQYFSHTVTAKGRPATIVGTINDSPANPRTNSQMSQRARFANAVKFYKHATSNFFKFAFEDKKKNESDYNAFMRHNISQSLLMDKSLVDSSKFPALGDWWLLSKGSLGFGQFATCEWFRDSNMLNIQFPLGSVSNSLAQGSPTVQDISLYLIKNWAFEVGDIVTFVYVSSDFLDYTLNGSDYYTAPNWQIIQFKVSLSNYLALDSLPYLGSRIAVFEIGGEENNYRYQWAANDSEKALWASIIVTRKKSSGLLATTSYLEPNLVARDLMAAAKKGTEIDSALSSWQAQSSAILQGGVADTASGVADNTDYSDVKITSIKQSVNSGSTTGSTLNIGSMTYSLNTITIEGTNLPDVSPTSSNVAICSVSNFTHTSDTSVSFIVNRGSSAGSFTIYYAGKAVVSGTVPQQQTNDQGVQQGSDGTGING